MSIRRFLERSDVRRMTPDMQLARSLLKTADSDLQFLSSLPLTEHSARKIMTNYYDVLRSILEALAAIDGYKVYSHEAFTAYLKEKGEIQLAEQFDRFRKIRNGINYYGESVLPEEVREHISQITRMIAMLKKKIPLPGSPL